MEVRRRVIDLMEYPIPAIFFALWALLAPVAAGRESNSTVPTLPWQPHDVGLTANEDHAWWEFPIRATFTHETSRAEIAVEGFWDGARRWVVRFPPPQPGNWSYRTASRDHGLDARAGTLQVREATATDIAGNPNLRGPVRIAPTGRHFNYGDGTPFLLLADTAWAANTARCGLGTNDDGPFFAYLADRKAKGFTAILLQYFHGYGDYPDAPGHRNEGGQAFFERDAARLNPEHFKALDRRMDALWANGFVAAIPTTWWAKTRACLFKPEDARRISAYCAVRYGAFNALWSVSGEYQYAFKDCGWTPADIASLGEQVQAHNPWRRPVSVHPSARLDWPAPHNVQSSRPFHGQPWLDHHWLQTGQSVDRLFNVATRLRDNRALEPATPVFLSEACYESAADPEAAYHVRWQVWAAFLNGAAGYGYGADGIWQFYDPADPNGEKGKDVKGVGPWRDALRFPGSTQLAPARKFLEKLEWWKLVPHRERVRCDGSPNPLPTSRDISAPHFAAIPNGAAVLYVPKGNASHVIAIERGRTAVAIARWYDPRQGGYAGERMQVPAEGAWTIPARPVAEEDWVLIVTPEVMRTAN